MGGRKLITCLSAGSPSDLHKAKLQINVKYNVHVCVCVCEGMVQVCIDWKKAKGKQAQVS